jgi:hypothetical protein
MAVWASASVGKDQRGNGALAYCAPTKAHAAARARGGLGIELCTAIGKGETCNDAKKAAKKRVSEKCKPCSKRYAIDYNTGDPEKWAVVEIGSGSKRVVSVHARGRATTEEADRLSRAACPNGLVPTAEENALEGLRRRRKRR